MKIESYVKAGGPQQPQRVVLAAGEDLDDAQASGQWIAAEQTVAPEEWR